VKKNRIVFMRNSSNLASKIVCALAIFALFFEMHAWAFASPVIPQVPQTSVEEPDAVAVQPPLPDPQQIISEMTQGSDYPVEVAVPSIQLDVPVIEVDVNAKGEMDVPDGNTNNVGWYKRGTIPGSTGSAVFDAHVFAALKNLRYAKPGDDIYVKTKSGKFLHFQIQESTVYKTADVPLQKLFNRNDAAYLNLITCAGKLTKDRSTYDHRLVDYAVLVDK
jgi:sortase (surface protein transpeptidase)